MLRAGDTRTDSMDKVEELSQEEIDATQELLEDVAKKVWDEDRDAYKQCNLS